MSEDPPTSLHSVSVVVTAEFHNPSILNPDFSGVARDLAVAVATKALVIRENVFPAVAADQRPLLPATRGT